MKPGAAFTSHVLSDVFLSILHPGATASTSRLAQRRLVGFFFFFEHIVELYEEGRSEEPLWAEEMIQMQSFWVS